MEEGIAETVRPCARPSVSDDGAGLRDCAAAVAELLDRHGFDARIMETEGAPVVYGEAGSGERALLLYNHYDIQPPGPSGLWESDPFEPTVRDGKLFARGASDDKGHITSRLAALDAFRAAYGEIPFRVKFLVEGEEEVGSPSLDGFVREHGKLLAADACVWEAGGTDASGRPVCFLGVRGMLGVELYARTMERDGHSGEQGYLPNAAWRLVWALSTLKDEDERVLIPGFYEHVVPPTRRQRELLAALPSSEGEVKRLFGAESFAGGLTGEAFKEAVFSPTCNVNGLTGGHQGEGSMAAVPAAASCKIDFRLVPDQDPDDLMLKLRAHLDERGFTDVEAVHTKAFRPAAVDPDDAFVRLVVDAAREAYGEEPVLHPLSGGSGPMHPFVSYLEMPVANVGVAYPGCRAHAPNEHFRIDDWLRGTRHMGHVLARFFAS